ncbi:eEF1A lysine and N-terminal methyltransferase [Linum perenne]
MALDVKVFESIAPSRFLTFTIPRPDLRTRLLRIAVLDSPFPQIGGSSSSQQVAALFVPLNRESDWVFSTESGHLQLLLSFPGVSRLVMIGRNPADEPDLSTDETTQGTQFLETLRSFLKPLLEALSPNTSENGFADVPIWEYVDNVIRRKVWERRVGELTGEMLVEDVELEMDNNDNSLDENGGRSSEFRRRLRFKRMPNLVQTEIRLNHGVFGEDVKFKPEIGVLVQPYLVAMVASLSLILDCMEFRIRNGVKPKALCLGVGGGALPSFLRSQLGFQVCGVEMDEEVLRVAKQYFGLDNSEVNVHIGNALDFVDKLAGQGLGSNVSKEDCWCSIESSFDVIMVDLDSSDARNGISAPPVEFIDRHSVSAARAIIADSGIMVVNVVPSIRLSYDHLIEQCRGMFSELYEIDVGNGENFILIAKKSPVSSTASDCRNNFSEKLKGLISGKYLDSIRKI